MDHREQEPPPLGPGGAGWQALGAARERAVFALQRRLLWPLQDSFEALGTRGRIGVLGGGGVAVAAVIAALVSGLSGGSGSSDAPAPVAAVQQPSTPHVAPAPAPRPKKVAPAKPSGPTLHGAPPDFAPAQNAKSGVGNAEALGGARGKDSAPGGLQADRGAGADPATSGEGPAATASDDPAATAKIGATPGATAAAQADDLATTGGNAGGDGTTGAGTAPGATANGDSATGAAAGTAAAAADAAGAGAEAAGTDAGFTGPPAPKAAKRTARRFAQAFVAYEVGGVDGEVRKAFGQTSTRQLSRSLLQRPPRQPANVKVPKAKVVNVVAGPSKGSVYTVSVSLLRVGVTSELRLQLEQGPGKKWQVTDVLG
jgi:hypothetical protein